ncbi:MAG: sensor histidine kinase [Defluviitaleaceae bacterium]|nr:sensor histidine kinase [Defluviitaleaceae bacterium]
MKKGMFPVSVKLFVGFFVLIMFFWILIRVFINNTYAEVLKTNEITFNLLTSNEIKLQLDFVTTLLRTTTSSLSNNENVRQLLLEVERDIYKDEYNLYSVKNLLSRTLEMHTFIANIHLITVGDTILSGAQITDEQQLIARYAPYIEKSAGGAGIEFWSEGIDNRQSYIMPIFMTNPRRIVGLAALDIDYGFLNRHLMSSAIRANERALIVNGAGQIIFQFPFHISYRPFLDQHPEVLQTSHFQKEAVVHGLDTLIVSERIAMNNWHIIRLIDLQRVTEETRRLDAILTNMLVVSLLVGLIYSLWFSRFITKPLRNLVSACKRVESGDFETQVTINSYDELGDLGKTFNAMVSQLHQSLEQEILNQKRRTEMELQILQAQVNPHFLYNTLDSIRWLAVMQNANNIAEMSQALVGLLKYNLAQPDENATLQDELESVRHYVKIQRFRYSDNFDYSEKLDPNTLRCVVPRFILQPLVENCIVHGFEDVGESYHLRISSFVKGEALHIKVIDNGSGMTPEHIQKVNSGMISKNRYNHIGVYNIRERIKLIFGDSYDLIYSSEPYVGTIAEVILPLNYETEPNS